MQALFAYQRSEGEPLAVGEKFLQQSMERIYDLFINELALAIVRSNHGIASAIATAQEYVWLAEKSCDRLPASVATDALLVLH